MKEAAETRKQAAKPKVGCCQWLNSKMTSNLMYTRGHRTLENSRAEFFSPGVRQLKF